MKYGILPKLRRVADEPSGRVSIGGGITRVDRGDKKGVWCLACGTSVNRNSLSMFFVCPICLGSINIKKSF